MSEEGTKTWCMASVVEAADGCFADLLKGLEKEGPGWIARVMMVGKVCKFAADIAKPFGGDTAWVAVMQLTGVGVMISQLKSQYEAKHGPVDWDAEIAEFEKNEKYSREAFKRRN